MLEASLSSQAQKGCRKCHEELYQGWQQTRVANAARDPQKAS